MSNRRSCEKTTNEEEAISLPNTCFSTTQEPQDFVTPPLMTSPQGLLSPLGQTQPLLLPRNTSFWAQPGICSRITQLFLLTTIHDELENNDKTHTRDSCRSLSRDYHTGVPVESDVNLKVCVNGDVKDVMFFQKRTKSPSSREERFRQNTLLHRIQSINQRYMQVSQPSLFVICSDNSVFSPDCHSQEGPIPDHSPENKRDMVQENLSLFDSVPS